MILGILHHLPTYKMRYSLWRGSSPLPNTPRSPCEQFRSHLYRLLHFPLKSNSAMPRTNLVIGANRGIGLGLVEELVSGRRSYLFERMRKHLPSQVKKHSTDVVYATARVPAEAKESQMAA
jgi:hypothetical protein